MKDRRNTLQKLNTALFGRDLRVTVGDVYSEVRPFDYCQCCNEDDWLSEQALPCENVYDIRFFGAATNRSDNADAINVAVNMAAETGGTVLVSGGDYVSTTVFLKSNVTLFIERGSSISSNRTGEGYNHLGIIHADSAENITLTGGGCIRGNGEYFGLKPKADANMTEHPEIIDVIQMRRDSRAQLRFAHSSKYGGPVYFKNCKNVRADNFMIYDSAHWSFRLENCEDVTIRNFVINNNRHVANADGFDIAGGRNISIGHCFISTADDGICLKNAIWLGGKGVMENITVSDCEVISCANAFKIGTETTYDIRNVTVENCRFYMTDIFPGTVSGIAIESADGAKVSGITARNITMDRVTCPVFIRLCNRNRAAVVNSETSNAVEFGKKRKRASSADRETFDMLGEVGNIVIEDITAENAELPVIVAGFRQKGTTKYVSDVTLSRVNITYAPYREVFDRRRFIPEYSDVYPESWRFRNLPAYALWARHVKGLKLLDFNCSVPRSTWKHSIITQDVI